LSSALCAAILRSDGLSEEIHAIPLGFLAISKKLRNDVLFKEALILSLDPFRQPRYLELTDPEVKGIAEKAYNAFSSQVLKACSLVLGFSVHYGAWREIRDKYMKITGGQPCWPEYFRNLEIDFASFGGVANFAKERGEARCALEALLKNQLQFDKSEVQSGRGKFTEYFLYSEVCDEVLPWGPTEMDW
jgi:hypothetical protein